VKPRAVASDAAVHENMVYGLVAPGYEMAEIVAANLTGDDRRFTGGDLSAKLKLMGIDVASFGENEADPDRTVSVRYEDPFGGVYRKLVFTVLADVDEGEVSVVAELVEVL
jgi:NAD(P)H-nitrite reductase large subunit